MRRPLLGVAVGWLLLALAYALGNPPLAAPDEADHFVRTVGIAEGELVGQPAPGARIGGNPAEIRFDRQTQRLIMLPAQLDPVPYNCYLADAALSAACLERRLPPRGRPISRITTVGTYPPAGVLAAAAVVRADDSAPESVRWGRLASLAVSLTLLIAAAVAVFDAYAGWLSLSGLLVACTPTVLYLAASLTPSGLEICAGMAVTASLMRIERRPAPAGVWWLFGISGALMMLSHPTGLAWSMVLVGGFVAWCGPRRVRALLLARPPGASAGLGILALGVAGALAWQLSFGPSTPLAYRALPLALSRVPAQYYGAARDVVAGFGYLEFRPPLVIFLAWVAALGVVVCGAIRLGDPRQRRAVVLAAALAVVIPVGAWLISGRAAGIGLTGREYLPLMVAFPVLAGEVLYRRRPGMSRRLERVLAAACGLAGAVQFAAWYVNAHRGAVGVRGPWFFASHAGWSPPLGWWIWLVAAAVAGLLLGGVAATRAQAGATPDVVPAGRHAPVPG